MPTKMSTIGMQDMLNLRCAYSASSKLQVSAFEGVKLELLQEREVAIFADFALLTTR